MCAWTHVIMDTVITFNKVVTLLTNPPTLAPCPFFSNLRALCHHMQRVLQHLSWTRATLSDGPDSWCHEPCTPSSPRLHFDFPLIREIKPYTTACKSPSLTQWWATPYLTQWATQRMCPLLLLTVPHRQRLMQHSCERATIGCCSKTSSEHASTCSTTT